MRPRPRTALAAALLAVVLVGCGTGGVPDADPGPTQTVRAPVAAERTHPPAPTASTPAWTPPQLEFASLPVADPWAVLPRAVPDPEPGAVPTGLLVAPSTPAGAPLYDAPRGAAFALLPVAAYQGDTSYPVVAQDGDWYQVMLVVRRGLPSEVGPSGVNEATGWVWAGDVTTSTTDLRITATLSTGEVTLWRGQEVLARTVAGIGTPETPTPVTRTFVMSIYPDPNATYSRVFVTFGAHSPTLDEFSGGPAPIAIHAYPTHSGAISNGCLRIPADMLDAFADVPLGTPVLITA